MAKLRCWNCGASIDEVPLPISRHATCSACFNELHCCRLCRHFEPQRTGAQCAEDRADPPVIKESANFCDWFRPDASAFSGERANRADAAKDRLQALFGSEDASEGDASVADDDVESEAPKSKEDEARARLDDLFK